MVDGPRVSFAVQVFRRTGDGRRGDPRAVRHGASKISGKTRGETRPKLGKRLVQVSYTAGGAIGSFEKVGPNMSRIFTLRGDVRPNYGLNSTLVLGGNIEATEHRSPCRAVYAGLGLNALAAPSAMHGSVSHNAIAQTDTSAPPADFGSRRPDLSRSFITTTTFTPSPMF